MTQPPPSIIADIDRHTAELLAAATQPLIDDMRDQLPMFVIYDHPRDHPQHFVARLWVASVTAPGNFVVRSPDLDALREYLGRIGLVHLSRSPEDDPVILESWI